ncbi:MAG: hypothetical protein M3Q69_11715 [Acidobacteriota bacterium]|nr:hypothetical protein [Acidobacteriota bacterium]
MKMLRIVCFSTLALVLAPLASAADFGVRAGTYNDADENFVGAELLYKLGSVNLNPNLEYSLQEDVTAGTLNLDLTFDVLHAGRITPYVGTGVGLAYAQANGTSNTDVLGNLIGGLSLDLESLTPYAQVKYFRVLDRDEGGDRDDLALTLGLRF